MEYLGTIILFIIALTIVGATFMQPLNDVTSQSDHFQMNLEAKEITTEMITTPGRSTIGNTDWDEDSELQSFGLAEDYLEVNKSKVDKLQPLDSPQDDQKITYDEFVNLTGAENQYQFNFTWMPTINTFENFQKESPPESPNIREPTGAEYDLVDDRVHYGNTSILGEEVMFLAVGVDGIYDRVYVNDTWDFRGVEPTLIGEELTVTPLDFKVNMINNLEDKPGTLVILERNEKEFGAQRDPGEAVVKFNRYSTYIDDEIENHPVRMEVFVW